MNFDHGFVIIAADDRVEPILGYSTTGRFNLQNIPDNMAAWLDGYRQGIAEVISSNRSASTEISQHWYNLKHNISEGSRSAIGPLLQTTWDQEPLYNNHCPVDANSSSGHAVTGCVATAMAQVIRYWEYPTTGVGTHTYTTHEDAVHGYADYGTLTVNYSAAHYDYSLMPPTLSSSSSAAQINEVAKLMYHCGVSVNMNYGPSGSGAAYVYIPDALMTNFAYPSGIQCVFKSSYTDNAWKNLIKNELNNARPVIYGGTNSSGMGHAFVCDGYDGDYFHINWGWGGYNDGNFVIPNPGGFTYDQNMIIGISAATSTIRCANHALSLSSPLNGSSDIHTTTVMGYNLSSSISVTTTGNFTVGSNSSSLGSSTTLPSSGGTLYIQYNPASSVPQYETGIIVLSSGSAHDTIHLQGTSYNTVCLPPKNLTATTLSNGVNLSWTAPIQNTPASTTLSWDSDYDGPMYFSSDITFCMLQRYEVSDLSSFNQHYLNSISFIPLAGITSCRIVAYQGGSYNGSTFSLGEQVVNQEVPISNLNFNEWNTIQLLNPYIIDKNRELWFGIIAHEDDDAIVTLGSSTYMEHKGGILGFYYGSYNESTNFTYLYEMNDWGLPYNITLKADIERISGNVIRYDIYKNNTFVSSTTNTYYQHNQNLSDPSYYDVYAVWNNYCSEKARVLATPTGPCLPSVTTNAVTQTSNTTATCGGNVTHNGNLTVSGRGVCWSTSHNPTIADSHSTDGNGTGSFSSTMTGLTPGTTYYVRAYATNSQGTGYGEEQSVTLYYVVPKSGTETYTINSNTVNVYDHAGPNGNYDRGCTGILTLNTGNTYQTFEITGNHDICYITDGTNYWDNLYIYDGNTTSGTLLAQLSDWGTISTPITSTQNSITIKFVAPSYCPFETIYSGFNLTVRKVGEVPVAIPTVTTANVTNIATTSATCGGNVTADGGASVTYRGVCWSTSPNPTISGSHTTNGSGTGNFSSSITGLNPNTTYYVRAYATNSAGTGYGEQKTFKTNCNTVTINVTGTTTINYGASTTLTASGANSYVWKSGTTTIGSNASVTVNPTSTTTYTVTGSNSYGCTGTKSVTVTVNNIPQSLPPTQSLTLAAPLPPAAVQSPPAAEPPSAPEVCAMAPRQTRR